MLLLFSSTCFEQRLTINLVCWPEQTYLDQPIFKHLQIKVQLAGTDGNLKPEFALLTEDDVRNLALACKKSGEPDPLPSSILSIHVDHLLPVITKMINLLLKTGRFADEWKNALMHPLLKKTWTRTGKQELPNKQLTVYF